MGPLKLKETEIKEDLPLFSSIVEALEYWSQRYPSKEYCNVVDFKGEEQKITFKDLDEESRRYAEWLKKMGLKKGERVILALPNARSFLSSFLGTLRAGGIAVPVVARDRLLLGLNRAAETLAHICRDSAAKYILTTEHHAALFKEITREHKELGVVLATVEKIPRDIQFSTDPLRVFPEDIAFIQYTSGSTSLPKGVVIRHHQMIAQIRSIMDGLKSNAKDVAVSWLPLFHDMGLVGGFLHSLYVGMKLILMSPEKFLFDPKSWLEAISKYKATMSAGPNSAYGLATKRVRPDDIKGLDLSSWRVAFSGSEPISVDTMKKFEEAFKAYGFNPGAVVPGYGMAENCLSITFTRPGEGLKYDCVDREVLEKEKKATRINPNRTNEGVCFVSCGKPVMGNEVMIVSDEGKILDEREIGEVVVRGPSVMDGYFQKEHETKKVIRNRWLYTGDLGYLAEGELYIAGRKKDMIIKGGRNYCPQDIEVVAQYVEGIRSGAVLAFGMYDEKSGSEKVVVLAEAKPDQLKHRERLAKEISRVVTQDLGLSPDEVRIYPRGTFQRTSSGKVQRAKYKQLYMAGKLKEKISFGQRFRYFRFRLTLLLSMMFYYIGSFIRRLSLGKRKNKEASSHSDSQGSKTAL